MTRTKTTLLIGIDIGSSVIRALGAFSGGNQSLPVPQITLELPTDGVDKGRIIDEKEVADVIAKLVASIEEELDEKAMHIVITISPSGLQSTQLSGFTRTTRGDAIVSQIDIDQAVKDGSSHLPDNKNRSIVHELPLRYKLDGAEASLPVLGLRANKIEIRTLYIHTQKQLLDTIKSTIALARIKIDDIVAGPLAESVPLLSKKERKAGVLLANIGSGTTSLVVYENNIPQLVTSLPIGGNDITKDIAIGLKIPLEDAEEIKCGVSTLPHSKRRVEEIIEARIEDICEKINKELDTIHRRELLPSGVVVTGKGALIPKIDYMMRNELKLPVRVGASLLSEFTRGAVSDESYARAFGALFFIRESSEREIFLEAIMGVITKAKRYISRFLP